MDFGMSDVIAFLALMATIGMWIKGRAFENSVHLDQVKWQERQEAQRQVERAEDRAIREEESTPRIKVSVSLTTHRATYYGKPDGRGGSLPTERIAELVSIKAENWGRIVVNLMAPYLTLSDGSKMSFPVTHLANAERTGGRFPSTLPPEHSVEGTVLATAAVKELVQRGFSGQVKILGTFNDALGREWHSDPFSVDLNHSYVDV
jgi:hypothetical protein